MKTSSFAGVIPNASVEYVYQYASIRRLNLPDASGLQTPIGSEFLNKFIAILEKHLADPDLGVAQLTRLMLVSRAQLNRKIHASSGKTPVRLLTMLRLEKACSLLVQTDEQVMEIAIGVGFRDARYFTRCFTRHYGISPRQYRFRARLER
ncbi:MAG: helix-turn-helix domain-containing protein [Lewinellaceae bacterium]|nr:helix-turn-helix domain-containing protein [Lewinellaceae bacterium]